MKNDFPQWLQAEMDKRGWNKSRLAEAAGLTPTAISDVMNGKRNPGLQFCEGVASALGVTPDIVLRHAGILPKEAERDEWIRRVEYKASQIENEEDRRIVEGLLDLLSPSRKKTSLRRHSER